MSHPNQESSTFSKLLSSLHIGSSSTLPDNATQSSGSHSASNTSMHLPLGSSLSSINLNNQLRVVEHLRSLCDSLKMIERFLAEKEVTDTIRALRKTYDDLVGLQMAATEGGNIVNDLQQAHDKLISTIERSINIANNASNKLDALKILNSIKKLDIASMMYRKDIEEILIEAELIKPKPSAMVSNNNSTSSTPNLFSGNPPAGVIAPVFVIPDDYFCKIGGYVMKDPVMIASGHSFERSEIAAWLKNNDTCPITREILTNKNMIPNYKLKAAIIGCREAHPEAFKDQVASPTP